MTYKRIYAHEKDHKTFKELKHKNQIESDVDMFHMLIEMALKQEDIKENIKGLNAKLSDGVTG